MKNFLSIVAGLLFLASFVPYVYGVVRRNIVPAKASWAIWCALDLMTVVGMYAEHALNGQIMAAAVGTSVVVCLSFRFGTPGWTRLDKFCLVGTAVGIAFWIAFRSPLIGIVSGSVLNLIGSVPTFDLAWRKPASQRSVTWPMGLASCVLTLAALPSWRPVDCIQPLVFLFLNIVMVSLVFIRPHFSRPAVNA